MGERRPASDERVGECEAAVSRVRRVGVVIIDSADIPTARKVLGDLGCYKRKFDTGTASAFC